MISHKIMQIVDTKKENMTTDFDIHDFNLLESMEFGRIYVDNICLSLYSLHYWNHHR